MMMIIERVWKNNYILALSLFHDGETEVRNSQRILSVLKVVLLLLLVVPFHYLLPVGSVGRETHFLQQLKITPQWIRHIVHIVPIIDGDRFTGLSNAMEPQGW